MRGIVRLGGSIYSCSPFVCPSRRRRHQLLLPSHLVRYGLHQLRPSPDPSRRLVRLFANRADSTLDAGAIPSWYVSEPGSGPGVPAQGDDSRLSTPELLGDGHAGGLEGSESPAFYESESEKAEELALLKQRFDLVMQVAQPDQVMATLLDPRFEGFVVSMPYTVFVEALHLLSPAYFVQPYREIHRSLHPYTVEIKELKQLQSIFDDFATKISYIIGIRRLAGHTLGLAEYTHLLDCARSLGDAIMADHIWQAMRQDEVTPDVQCYNYYMEAKVWDSAYAGLEKYRLRVTPYSYRKRRYETQTPGWKGYGTGARSVRREVLQIFNEMVEAGNQADETSFVNLILASCRVGHYIGIINILKTVWNVDMDKLKRKSKQSSLEPATEFDRSSPLYPTDHLLYAVAHSFGTNNDIPAALRVIDFISHSYDIKVTEKVWLELLERSFVLSRPRFGHDAHRNAKGQVTHEFLSNMYDTMTTEPFNIKPTIEMHRILAKTAWDQSMFLEFHQHMRASYEILRKTREKRKTARSIVEAYLKEPRLASSQLDPALLQSRGFGDAVHTYDILRLEVAQQTISLERLARLLLIHHRWVGRDNLGWERTLLPRAVEEWRDFLPETFIYSISSGLVEFHGKTHWGKRKVTRSQFLQVRRPTLDNGIELDPQSSELEDEVIWAVQRSRVFHRDLSSPVLKRLFEPLRIRLDPNADDMLLEDLDEAGEYVPLHPTKSLPPRIKGEWEIESSRKQKQEELDHAFGPVCEDLPVA